MNYIPVVGLEIHTQLATKSKLFCSCSTEFGAPPNSNICPVCLGMPGVLPVLNREAVKYAIMMALATNCRINRRSGFSRKNYFYPDLPKGYQITQYEVPIAEGGYIEIEADEKSKRIGITRIHIEEDAGKSLHPEGKAEEVTSVDFNRCGVPLIEIVSEPDISSPGEAVAYASKIKQLLEYLGICRGVLAEGNIRFDINVSVMPEGASSLGVRTEIKNLNSFHSLAKTIEHEIKRQIKVLDDGGRVVHETRLWDEKRLITRSMRTKEEISDYRYFPEPDLLTLVVTDKWLDEISSTLPELPDARCSRIEKQYGIPHYNASVLTSTKPLADYFEQVAKLCKNSVRASNWVITEVMKVINERKITVDEFSVRGKALAELLDLIDDGVISQTAAKEVFSVMLETGKSAARIVEEKGLFRVSDEQAIREIVDKVIAEHPKEVKRYQGGKKQILGFFIGQVMKLSGGKADPKVAQRILQEALDN